MKYELALYGIAVHVLQFLFHFFGRVARTTLQILSFLENSSASTNHEVRTTRSHAEGAPPSVL
jgi:hypothetical protein